MAIFPADSDARLTVIRPPRWLPHVEFGELWHYRELFLIFVWRDLKVRYKQTLIGVLWALIQPFLLMVVFSVINGKFAQMPANELPYPIFVFAGVLPWMFFANSLSAASGSLIQNVGMVTKVYFPRLILPAASTIVYVVDLLLASTILIGMMVYYETYPSWELITAPLFLLLAMVFALGSGLLLGALNVRYRDVGHALPFLIMLGIFVTPVAYSITGLTDTQQLLYSLNPMTTVVNGFRWAWIDHNNPPQLEHILVSTGVALFIFVVGLLYFRRSEPRFADTI